MKTSELIAGLQSLIDVYGDLPILGGYMSDDSSEIELLVLGEDDQEMGISNSKPAGIFLEGKW